MNSIKVNKTAILCLLAIYIIWGSTYLAIRYAIETIPAFTLSSMRFIIAAAFMAVFSLVKKEAPLTSQERTIALITGTTLVLGNAIVCVVEYWVPSGIVAVIVGSIPIWMMLTGWIFFHQNQPNLPRSLGALIGLLGVGLIALNSGEGAAATSEYAQYGILFLCGSGILWSVGTLLQRRLAGAQSLFRFTALQMSSGALLSVVIALAFERPWASVENFSATSLWAMLYLVVFGSIIGFTAYSWLSRNVESHIVSSYAFVNPVIAVALGWVFFQEPITPLFLGATVLVLVGLALLVVDWKKIRSKAV
jgi:drug/metabolite transporter (DMT)-like permease